MLATTMKFFKLCTPIFGLSPTIQQLIREIMYTIIECFIDGDDVLLQQQQQPAIRYQNGK